MQEKCPLCLDNYLIERKESPTTRRGYKESLHHINCRRCGIFEFLSDALEVMSDENGELGNVSSRKRANFISWLWEYGIKEIDHGAYKSTISLPNLDFHEMADKLLLAIEKETHFYDQQVDIKDANWLTKSWSINYKELSSLVRYLSETGRIQLNGGPRHDEIKQRGLGVIIRPQGWEKLRQLREYNPNSNKAFVAMWFSDETKDAFHNGFRKGILGAGYKPFRIDMKEHINKIDDEIFAEINTSRFLIADLTNHRGGVYYEAGLAMGKAMPVIWTCRRDMLPGAHFDVRQFNTIDWENPQDLSTRLENRILAVIGKGNYREE